MWGLQPPLFPAWAALPGLGDGGGGGVDPQGKELRLASDFLGEILQNTITQSKTLTPGAESQVQGVEVGEIQKHRGCR